MAAHDRVRQDQERGPIVSRETRNALIASALIMAFFFFGMLAMPKIMTFVTGFGPIGGVALALIFMCGFVALFWMRSRYQQRIDRRGEDNS
jgi:Flp pilus assembly protein TadB